MATTYRFWLIDSKESILIYRPSHISNFISSPCFRTTSLPKWWSLNSICLCAVCRLASGVYLFLPHHQSDDIISQLCDNKCTPAFAVYEFVLNLSPQYLDFWKKNQNFITRFYSLTLKLQNRLLKSFKRFKVIVSMANCYSSLIRLCLPKKFVSSKNLRKQILSKICKTFVQFS